ncbi:hypothetical protein LguiB_012858 [Lonicera macranthoides]
MAIFTNINPFSILKPKSPPAVDWSETKAHETLHYLSGSSANYDRQQARSVFLKSYRLSERDGLKEKVKRCVKVVKEVGVVAFVGIRKELLKRKVGFRVYRFTLARPSNLMVVRCFVPWSCTYKGQPYSHDPQI